MSDDLGGAEQLSAGQKAALTNLFRSVVASNGLFEAFLRDGNAGHLDKVGAFHNAELRAIGVLGLRRPPRDLPTLTEYLERRQHEAAQDAPGSTIVDKPEPQASSDGEHAAEAGSVVGEEDRVLKGET